MIEGAGGPHRVARRRALAVGLTGSGIGVGVVSASLLAASLCADFGDHAWALVYRIERAEGVLALLAVLWLVRHAQAAPAGRGLGGFGALRRMPGWRPLLGAYSTFGFMYLLVLGFLTTRLEDDSAWTGLDAAFAFTLVGVTMIFGRPLLVTIAQRTGVRAAAMVAFALWPVLVGVVLTGVPVPALVAWLGQYGTRRYAIT